MWNYPGAWCGGLGVFEGTSDVDVMLSSLAKTVELQVDPQEVPSHWQSDGSQEISFNVVNGDANATVMPSVLDDYDNSVLENYTYECRFIHDTGSVGGECPFDDRKC